MIGRLCPHHVAERVTDIDCEALFAQGVRGIILDLDNTLTPCHCLEVTPEVMAWIAGLQSAGLRACIVSNASSAHRVRVVADKLGLPWMTRACKPLARAFRRGMRMMETTPETTAMIGDQMFTDIYGANCLSIYTIMVDPVSPQESIFTRMLQRPLERMLGRGKKKGAAAKTPPPRVKL